MGGGFDVPAAAPKKSIPTMPMHILNARTSSQSSHFDKKTKAGMTTSTGSFYNKMASTRDANTKQRKAVQLN